MKDKPCPFCGKVMARHTSHLLNYHTAEALETGEQEPVEADEEENA